MLSDLLAIANGMTVACAMREDIAVLKAAMMLSGCLVMMLYLRQEHNLPVSI